MDFKSYNNEYRKYYAAGTLVFQLKDDKTTTDVLQALRGECHELISAGVYKDDKYTIVEFYACNLYTESSYVDMLEAITKALGKPRCLHYVHAGMSTEAHEITPEELQQKLPKHIEWIRDIIADSKNEPYQYAVRGRIEAVGLGDIRTVGTSTEDSFIITTQIDPETFKAALPPTIRLDYIASTRGNYDD